MEILKKIIKTIVFSNKMTANIYHKLQYGVQISDDLVITKIKQIAHRFDHRLMDGISINRKDIYEIEYFLDIAFDREIKFDDSLMWALSLYSLAKYNGAKSYKFKNREEISNKYDSNLSEIIRTRRSIRKWKNEPVSIELIKRLIKASLWAPSSCNRQPVRIIILEDEQKEFIKSYFSGTFWHKAPVQMLILCNISAYENSDVYFPYLDAGAFIQNLLLLLHEAGLGACWLGFKMWNVKQEIYCDKRKFESFYKYFKIGPENIPISMVVAGEYEFEPKTPNRQSLDTVILEG